MKKKLFISLIVLAGFVLVYFFWPRTVDLPNLGTIEEPHLTSINGKEFTFSTEKPKLVAFFYTQCPDVCPMTITDLNKLHQTLQEKGVKEAAYDVVLITLDPAVDTVEKIKRYKKHFNISAENWTFLRGTVEQTRDVTKQFNMAFKKETDGFIVHSTTMYLLDEKNQIRAYHDMNTGQKSVNIDEIAANIHSLVN